MQKPVFTGKDFKPVHEYAGGNLFVRFEPIKDRGLPGFSHSVLVLDHNRILRRRDWLSSQFKPSAEHAAFYANKMLQEDAGFDA